MKTVLAIGAHPDDIEIGCGGTLSLFKDKGYSIVHLVATSGEQGSLTIPPTELSDKREQEALSSGKVLGASEVIFLRLPDGLTSYNLKTKIRVIEIIRSLAPEIIFTHSKHDTFSDHQIIRSLTESAIAAASGPWYPGAGKLPHQVKTVYGYEVWHPMSSHQASFNITTTFNRKKEALNCHFSQVTEVDYIAAIEGLALYRGAMTMKGRYVEVFEAI